jgi:hypothetical protein
MRTGVINIIPRSPAYLNICRDEGSRIARFKKMGDQL